MGRVVITGISVISPVGNSLEEVMHSIETGKKGIGRIRNFDTSHFLSNIGAEVKKGEKVIRWNSDIDRKEVFIKMAMEELFSKYKWVEHYPPADRVMNLGAGLDYFDLPNYVNSGENRYGGWQKFSRSTYRIVEELASKYNIYGGFTVNVTACVASSQAIGLSYRMLKRSGSRIIITGGFDSMLNHLHYMGFYKLGALSTWENSPEEACRPFDKNRCGIVLGEGAMVFILQNADEADPSCTIAEIAGYSSTMDAYMVTDPDPKGESLAKAAVNAIEEAGISPQEIDCVHLHGTGTLKNELAEYEAMKLVFPNYYKEVPVYSMKGQVGHLIGACGAMEMLGVIYSIQNQAVPQTVNFKEADPTLSLFVVKDKPLKMKIHYVLKLNSAFGGQNTALVVKKYA